MPSSSPQQDEGNDLTVILGTLQQGVIAINNTTQAIALIFPST